MTNLLITGAGGVLGSNLINGLNEKDFVIYALGLDLHALQELFRNRKNVHSYTNLNDVPLDRIDCVVHCAFARSQNGADLASSIDFARTVFESAVANNIPRVINISSQSLYGSYRIAPSTETDVLNPIDKYAVAKYACEQLADVISRNTKTKITSVRLASLIGPQFQERLVNKMLKQATESGYISIVGGTQVFSFLDLRDAVGGLRCMLQNRNHNWHKVYNLGPATSCTIIDIANNIRQYVARASSKNIDINVINDDSIKISIMLNQNRFVSDFRWRASHSIYDSIGHIYMNCFAK